jgi:hypothetical protein
VLGRSLVAGAVEIGVDRAGMFTHSHRCHHGPRAADHVAAGEYAAMSCHELIVDGDDFIGCDRNARDRAEKVEFGVLRGEQPSTASSRKQTPIQSLSFGQQTPNASSPLSNEGSKR